MTGECPAAVHAMLRLPRGIFFLLVLASPLAPAQPFHQSFNPITVIVSSDTLRSPFSGGIGQAANQFVDIDHDGDLDLFVLDRDKRLSYYENAGSASKHDFQLVSIGFHGLPVTSWFRFADLDADGDADLLSNGASGTVIFHRNTGTPGNPSFVKEADPLNHTANGPVLSEEISHPALADADGDGDLDFFSGNSAGTIWYYENTGTPSAFALTYVTDRYQGIQIIGIGGSGRNPVIPSSGVFGGEKILHGAMALAFGDVDGDADPDMLWGDFFNPGLYFLRNDGTAAAPQYVIADSSYPNESPVLSSGFNAPGLVDLDGDGDLDLAIAVLYPGVSRDNFYLYRNTGTDTLHHFVRESGALIPSIDAGASSSPLFVDIDGDGDRDLLIGAEDSLLTLFTQEADGSYTMSPAPTLNLGGLFNISPAASDLNGDAMQDLIIGDFNGRVRFYLRSDSAFIPTPFSLDGETFGLNASPALADVTGDLLPELFIGTGGGRLVHYANHGTSQQPDFVLQSTNFLAIDVGDDARPALADMDGDGDRDLVVGALDGSIHLWRNVGTATAPQFIPVPGFFDATTAVLRATPAFEDLDGDGDPDLVLGNAKGGLYYYENLRGSIPPPASSSLSAYPNPSQGTVRIRFWVSELGFVSLRIYDILGREIAELVAESRDPGEYTSEWDTGRISSGVYIVTMRAAGEMISGRIVLIK